MSPNCLQIVTTSALLLATVYLSLGAHIPTRRAATGATVPPATLLNITKRTGSEAINAKIQVDNYLKETFSSDNVAEICSNLVPHLVLPCPQNVSGCNSSVNASTNLHYLLYMYSHLLGLMYQNNTNETLMEQLDLLEMVYYRLSHQMQRYLQAHNLTSGNAKHIEHQEIDGEIAALEQEFTHLNITNSTLCQLRTITISILSEIGEENSSLRPYQFCKSLNHLKCL